MSDGPPPDRPDRPAPDVERGPRRVLGDRAQRLVDRAGAVDRRGAAHERLATVRASEVRRARRARLLMVVGWIVTTVVTVGVGALAAGWPGVGAALGLLVAVALLQRATRRAAAKRGAVAWDWQARRYRLLGNPSAQVQNLDGASAARDALGQRSREDR